MRHLFILTNEIFRQKSSKPLASFDQEIKTLQNPSKPLKSFETFSKTYQIPKSKAI